MKQPRKMKATMDQSSEAYALGLYTEDYVEQAIQEYTDFKIVQDSQLGQTDRAPMIRKEHHVVDDRGNVFYDGKRVELTVKPDLDIAGGGRRVWVEVKGRTTEGYWSIEGWRTQIIDCKRWADYEKTQMDTGTPVVIILYQVRVKTGGSDDEVGEVLVASLDTLNRNKKRGCGDLGGKIGDKSPEDFWFFNREAFKCWAQIEDGFSWPDNTTPVFDESEMVEEKGWFEAFVERLCQKVNS